jgi:hypothetical protein
MMAEKLEIIKGINKEKEEWDWNIPSLWNSVFDTVNVSENWVSLKVQSLEGSEIAKNENSWG